MVKDWVIKWSHKQVKKALDKEEPSDISREDVIRTYDFAAIKCLEDPEKERVLGLYLRTVQLIEGE